MIPIHHLLSECAPLVAPATMAAIVRVESGGNPLAMYNNATRQTILPSGLAQARAYLSKAIAAGQKVDVGLAQVDTENFAQYGLNGNNAFNACANLRVGSQILAADYFKAARRYGVGQQALFHAFEAYNSGRLRGDSPYALKILSAAGAPALVPVTYQQRESPVFSPWVGTAGWTVLP
ncbi:MAG: lytic transglycosylase domain-containing protein [Acidithiobacillus sp.]